VLARSRYKVERSRKFIPGYEVGGGQLRSVAVQTVSKPEISQGAGFKLRADARVRVQRPLRICLRCRRKAKTVTNNLPILSVLVLVILFFCLRLQSCYFVNNHGIVYLQALLKALVEHQPVRLLNVLAKWINKLALKSNFGSPY
jgi:hypothetical protein